MVSEFMVSEFDLCIIYSSGNKCVVNPVYPAGLYGRFILKTV
jgi:hypothetical protein